jgi:phenylpropionate dioxygenase-like ring-hydroxylating dioxygenase large terminal subunit
MLSKEDNELLCRVGPGTPMGSLFRQYWLPAMLSSELPRSDGDQVRVKLLGEELIGFRDTDGRVGLVQNACPHRGASLFFARNEECGLRCVYHGWKFDVTGQCVDMPNEPAESNFKTKVKARAYPCVERGGVVWTYMGPREAAPALPDLEGNMLPESTVYAETRNCNWMQALEGDIDTVHFSWLHCGHLEPEDAAGDFLRYQVMDRHPKFSVVDTEWGTSYAAFIPVNDDKTYCRMAHFLFPCYSMIPQGEVMANRRVRAWVPMDDEHVIWFIMSAPPLTSFNMNATAGAKTLAGGRGRAAGQGHEMRPNTSDWYGRFQPVPDAANDYQLDRDSWRRGETWAGLPSVTIEDHMVTETMGTIYNRPEEHLGTSDAMIIRTRQRLLRAAEALDKDGLVPPGVDEPQVYQQRSGGLLLAKDADWFEATVDARRAFVDHPSEAILASVKP